MDDLLAQLHRIHLSRNVGYPVADITPAYWSGSPDWWINYGNYSRAGWIEQLAAEGISDGCGNGDFCPEEELNRAEVAVQIARAFGL
jgi:hypothetical protein